MQLTFWRPQTRRRRQEVDSIGKDVARNTRHEERSRQGIKKRGRGKGGKGAANGSEIDVSVRTYDSNALQGKGKGYIEVQKEEVLLLFTGYLLA